METATMPSAPTTTTLPRSMKAVVHTAYGSSEGVELRELDLPEIEDHQVLVRAHASSVNPAEWYGVMGPLFARVIGRGGIRKPKDVAVGGDFAGRIEAVGKDVTTFRPGDEVFGLSPHAWGEYAKARADRIARKPTNVSFEEAGATPIAGLTALQALRDHGDVQPGQKVLINGASGGVGTFAVQIAKALGADVTAVCSTTKVDLARELGADRVVDYTREDFTKLGVRHDVLIDVVGSRPFRQFKRVLARDAIVVIVGGPMNTGLGPLPHLAATVVSGTLRRRPVKFFMAKGPTEELEFLAQLMETSQVKPVIEARYELSRVREALDRLGTGHARGKIVLTM